LLSQTQEVLILFVPLKKSAEESDRWDILEEE